MPRAKYTMQVYKMFVVLGRWKLRRTSGSSNTLTCILQGAFLNANVSHYISKKVYMMQISFNIQSHVALIFILQIVLH